MATITELAEECGVSVQAVRSFCAKGNFPRNERKAYIIGEAEKTAILQHFRDSGRKAGKENSAKEASGRKKETEAFATAIEALTDQLRAKDSQIEQLNGQIASLTEMIRQKDAAIERSQEALLQAQALHAGTIADRQARPDTDQEENSNRKAYRPWWRFWQR